MRASPTLQAILYAEVTVRRQSFVVRRSFAMRMTSSCMRLRRTILERSGVQQKRSTVGGASEDVGERHVGFGRHAMPCRAIPCEAS